MNFTSDPTGDPAAVPQPDAYEPPRAQPPVNIPDITVEDTPADELTPGGTVPGQARAAAAHATATWLGLFRQPPSISDAWNLSSIIDRRRVPGESGLLAFTWWFANRTERIFLFTAVVLLLIPVATLLWAAGRPTRRIGLYIVLLLVFVVIPHIAGG